VASLTKTVDGKALPADKFAMVGDPDDVSTWHLPVDDDHIQSAVDRFGQETHGSAEQKSKAAQKIAAAAKAKGIDTKAFEAKYLKSTAHADFGGQWIEIFKAGKYAPQGDWNGTATASDLQRVAASYDPVFHEAPAVIGHPADNMPAYAWTDRLKVDGDKLLAKFREVDPEFESAVQTGRFKKRSASFYLDGGKLAGLRHVGFLGAKPPEVKGLKNLTFDDHGQSFAVAEFGEEETVEKSLKEQLAELFAPILGGKKDAAASFSETDVQAAVVKAIADATKPLQDQVTTLKSDLDKQSASFAEREKKIAGSESAQRAAAAIAGLKEKGRWIPAFDKLGGAVLFTALAESTVTVEFGEADKDGKKPTVTPLQALVTFMESLPKIVPPGRLVEMGTASARQAKGTGDPFTDAINARAKEKNISFSEAMTQVAEESPELSAFPRAAGAA